MKELKALVKIKSLMTLSVMFVFVYMSVTDKMPIELTSSIIMAVITYYFNKKEDEQG